MKRVFTAIIAMLLASILMLNSCALTDASSYSVSETDDDYLIKCTWSYKGKMWQYQAEIPIAIYDHFKGMERSGDYDSYVYNELDDDWLGYTANSFSQIAQRESWDSVDTAGFVMSFVQSLPYALDKNTTGWDEYPRYPIESMVDSGIAEGETASGIDCEDTTILLVSILREMGYDAALLLYVKPYPDSVVGHMAAGVGITRVVIDNWNRDYELTYYDSNEKYYAYCETTAEGYRFGEKDPDMTGSAEVVPITPPQAEA